MKRTLALMLIVASIAASRSRSQCRHRGAGEEAGHDADAARAARSCSRSSRSGSRPLARRTGSTSTYSPIGSGGGISAITARTVDFAASDAPLSSDQLTACKGCVVIPWALATSRSRSTCPISVASCGSTAAIAVGHLPRHDHELERSQDQEDQPECNLPDPKITPVYRSDNSGTSYEFTDYLSAVNATWKSKFGTGTNAQWPAGVGAAAAPASPVSSRRRDGAHRRTSMWRTRSNKLRFASILNSARQVRNAGSARHQRGGATRSRRRSPVTVTSCRS